MKKSQLTKITTILPFDSNYVKVGKNSNMLWNLMDSEGNLISETWFENNVILKYGTQKWIDDFMLRATLNMPKNVREKLTELWGEPVKNYAGEYNENYTWTFTKDKLEFIIDTLNNID